MSECLVVERTSRCDRSASRRRSFRLPTSPGAEARAFSLIARGRGQIVILTNGSSSLTNGIVIADERQVEHPRRVLRAAAARGHAPRTASRSAVLCAEEETFGHPRSGYRTVRDHALHRGCLLTSCPESAKARETVTVTSRIFAFPPGIARRLNGAACEFPEESGTHDTMRRGPASRRARANRERASVRRWARGDRGRLVAPTARRPRTSVRAR